MTQKLFCDEALQTPTLPDSQHLALYPTTHRDFHANKPIRSPLFYVGDKYKLMPQLKRFFPKNIDVYIEPFVGGGSSFLNTEAKEYLLNDSDSYLIALHTFLSQSKKEEILDTLTKLIESYNLSFSLYDRLPPLALRKAHKKTYFAMFNKEGYMRLREDFNRNKSDMARLYLLLIYGFNHMLRFNAKGDFNLPVGNVDCNKNVLKALEDYFSFVAQKDIHFHNKDFRIFLQDIESKLLSLKDSNTIFIYLDPPYLISGSEYNKLWNESLERELYEILTRLDSLGLQWGLSNLVTHKGRENTLLKDFMQQYQAYAIQSNYISFNDNSIKKDSKEVYVTNVGQ
ncbi:DNA adenine methylase [uncultured Helicobacter sp.]|uniref:DNA adenine methylase n=1 Tax=uncultured Helicobacter sp. TaxID=175537 RepID=UPI00374E25DF